MHYLYADWMSTWVHRVKQAGLNIIRPSLSLKKHFQSYCSALRLEYNEKDDLHFLVSLHHNKSFGW